MTAELIKTLAFNKSQIFFSISMHTHTRKHTFPSVIEAKTRHSERCAVCEFFKQLRCPSKHHPVLNVKVVFTDMRVRCWWSPRRNVCNHKKGPGFQGNKTLFKSFRSIKFWWLVFPLRNVNCCFLQKNIFREKENASPSSEEDVPENSGVLWGSGGRTEALTAELASLFLVDSSLKGTASLFH